MKKILLGFLLVASFCGLRAQNDNVLLIIGKDSITADEFLKAYSKNNNLATTTESELRDYLNLFINFKLKVKEGELLQLDTARKFKMELKQYQNQSEQQYLVDKEVTKELEDEVLEHALYNIRASHILINCSENAQPKDTAVAYAKALSIRDEILSKSISFADAAVRYSDDPSARDMVNPQSNRLIFGNKGDLGYFTVFDLIYPFEVAAYNTKVGEVSMPVRTSFGYHLIYVQDRIQSVQEISIAQIFISDTLAKSGKQSETTKGALAHAQKELANGVAFEDVAKKYSEDKNVAETGGKQEPFAPNRRQGDFVKSVLSLKEGEISQPIATQNGWHIIKLIEIKPFVIDEDTRYSLVNRISRDNRSNKSKDSFIAKLKKEYNYAEPGRAKAIKVFLKNMPAEFFQSKETDLTKIKGLESMKPMATFADQTITAEDYAKYLNRFKGMRLTQNEFEPFIQERFDMYLQDKIVRYEKSQLTEKYSELRELIQEFHDGMLLYEINTTKVWAAAVQDSTGLVEFYNAHTDKYIDKNTQQPKPLSEIRAIVITDFQEYLDEQWIQELRKKYQPYVDEKVFSTIIKK